MALLTRPTKPLAASLAKQPMAAKPTVGVPLTNPSPRASAALANIGVAKPPAPAGNAAMRAATAAAAGMAPTKPPAGPRMAAPSRPRGLGTVIRG